MKNKIIVTFVCTLLIATITIIPQNIEIEATSEYGNPDIDHGYIYNLTEELSNILFEEDEYWNQSRYFGTLGEQHAADKIAGWMNETGLENVHLETINATWCPQDEGEPFTKGYYFGPLNQARVMQDYYLNITIYNENTWEIVDSKNLTGTTCFPYYTKALPSKESKTEYGINISIYEKFLWWRFEPTIALVDTHWATKNYYELYGYDNQAWIFPKFKGYIAIDTTEKTHFLAPPGEDHKWWLIPFERPRFYINGSTGNWIRNALQNCNLKVKADYYTHWEKDRVTSYSVIGQINGTDPDPKNISIIGAHYDCMWSQGTIDEAAETALSLGIAKFIKDRELESKLKHTVKFIAFGAEDFYPAMEDYGWFDD